MNPAKTKQALGFGLSLLFLLGLSLPMLGCNTNKSAEGIAATINGYGEVTEQAVGDYLTNYRELLGKTDNQEYKDWMNQNGQTNESMRNIAIDALAQDVIVEAEAKTLGLAPSDDEVNARFEQDKQTYGENWKSFLENTHYTEDGYKAMIKSSMYEEALIDGKFNTDEVAQAYAAEFAGKNIETIMFSYTDDATKAEALETAQDVLDRLNNGEEWEALQGEYPMGTSDWTRNTEDGGMYVDEAINQAAQDMEVGSISAEPIDSSATSAYLLVKCVDVFAPADGDAVSMSDVPEDLQTTMRSEAFYDWSTGVLSDVGVVTINPMPEYLPYMVQ